MKKKIFNSRRDKTFFQSTKREFSAQEIDQLIKRNKIIKSTPPRLEHESQERRNFFKTKLLKHYLDLLLNP